MLNESIPFLIVAAISLPLAWLGEMFGQSVPRPKAGAQPSVPMFVPYIMMFLPAGFGSSYGFYGLSALGAAAFVMGDVFGESLAHERYKETSKREALLKAVVNSIKLPVATIITYAVLALAWVAVVSVNRYFPLPFPLSIHWIPASLGYLTQENVVRWLGYAATAYFTTQATASWLVFRDRNKPYATTPRKEAVRESYRSYMPD
jgi:hypothetical protein